jgi:hypothetical protein
MPFFKSARSAQLAVTRAEKAHRSAEFNAAAVAAAAHVEGLPRDSFHVRVAEGCAVSAYNIARLTYLAAVDSGFYPRSRLFDLPDAATRALVEANVD